MAKRFLTLNIMFALVLQLVFVVMRDYMIIRQVLGTFIPLGLSIAILYHVFRLLKTRRRDDTKFWVAYFIGMLFYTASYVVWAFAFIQGKPVISTPLSFGLWVMMYPFLFFAIMYKIIQLRNKEHVYQYLFHITTLIIIIFSLVFHFVFEPYVVSGDMTIWRFFVLVIEPFLSVLLMMASIVLYFLTIGSNERRMNLFFVLGFMTQALAEVLYVIQMIEDTYVVGQFTDVLWVFALLNMLAATYLSRHRPEDARWRVLRIVDHESSILPYVWILLFTITTRTIVNPTLNALSVAVLVLMAVLISYQLLVVRRNTELLNSYEEIMYLTPLTGLRNRTSLLRDLPNILKRIIRLKGSLALVVINLDRFKIINDALGRDYGDAVLKEVASRLAFYLDQSAMLYHLSGDEFVLLVYNQDKPQLIALIEQLTESLAEPIYFGEQQMTVTASIGISLAPKDGRKGHELLQMAEQAMHQAKSFGKNQYFFFDRLLKQQLDRRLLIENELKFAVNRGEILVYYQPKYMLEPEALIGFEALLRWDHPTFGFISPGEAIPIAEETGQINALGYYMLDEVFHHVKQWQTEHDFFGVVSINVSAIQLKQVDFYAQINFLLNKHQLDSKFIELELTESAMMEVDDVLPKLEQLKALGLKLSLDDFGTGYSSLFVLKELPVDTIKIDQAFVFAINDPRSKNIIKTILDIGSNLGLQVIAEGIENTDSIQRLKDLGCLFGQGYYYARPMPLNEVTAYINRHHDKG
ncbi:hypothetical protein GCM10012290_14870 [Halolactibacillus alkaliphilus]|uniref:GGDEF-domain containing protein n=1 Tax=Halolactibacillus alkaliphilus TaxID=442899 RepID=A0A511X1E7_9BACI|nr:EAL domain-containing protein [Halolactibacillus alkaliphilus]GEN56773.1 hypothetical protein HAL01_12370 [Halolactibacillus alkaliphilus]GGN70752.1 hypothetical protein GCM10012290_14870 [Halolactibacillus alkaliphilus]SFO79642.1 diguanylate cyclase (GGDEF) domain-containing protein [Halolactibacillus alkaliphilus]